MLLRSLHESAKQVQHFLCSVFPTAVAASGNVIAVPRASEHGLESPGQQSGITRRNEHAAVLVHQLGDAAHVGRDNRAAAIQCFYYRVWAPFSVTWQREDIGRSYPCGYGRRIADTNKNDTLSHSEIARQFIEVGPRRSSPQGTISIRDAREISRHRQ